MAHTKVIDGLGVTWTFSGEVNMTEFLEAQAELYGEAEFDNIRYQIVDMLQVNEFNVTVEDIEKIAALDLAASESNPRVKIAIVANSELQVTLAYFYDSETANSPWTHAVFDTLEQAQKWAAW